MKAMPSAPVRSRATRRMTPITASRSCANESSRMAAINRSAVLSSMESPHLAVPPGDSGPHRPCMNKHTLFTSFVVFGTENRRRSEAKEQDESPFHRLPIGLAQVWVDEVRGDLEPQGDLLVVEPGERVEIARRYGQDRESLLGERRPQIQIAARLA